VNHGFLHSFGEPALPVLDARSLAEADLDALRELHALLHPTGVASAKARKRFAAPRVVGGKTGTTARIGGHRPTPRSTSAA
jgi:hypothetical protein